MLCIDNRITDVYFNLAAEEYLLKNTRKEVFMLWQNEPAVVIGKHQDIFDEVNTKFANENQIKIARRLSGGGAVYHDLGNLNLTFIETNASVNFDSYVQQLINLLNALGITASADERRGINIHGLKISGSAQSIHKDRVLFHATLLFSSDLQRLTTSLERLPAPEKTQSKRKVTVQSVKSPVTNISRHLSHTISIKEVKEFIINYYTKQKTENKTYAFTTEDIRGIEQLRNIKYATESWIYAGEFIKKQSI
jgi:lipoyltransferase and lipoate-protein ligase